MGHGFKPPYASGVSNVRITMSTRIINRELRLLTTKVNWNQQRCCVKWEEIEIFGRRLGERTNRLITRDKAGAIYWTSILKLDFILLYLNLDHLSHYSCKTQGMIHYQLLSFKKLALIIETIFLSFKHSSIFDSFVHAWQWVSLWRYAALYFYFSMSTSTFKKKLHLRHI